MNKHTILGYSVFILSLLTSLAAGATENATKAFIQGSFDKILVAKADKPFILSLWSLDCPPCIRELTLWSELHTDYPQIELVLVSTDGTDARPAINALLKKTLSVSAAQKLESWVFADEFVERLRFEIDPKWYGELPRTIFFARDHRRHSVSGLLKRQQIEQWIHRQTQ